MRAFFSIFSFFHFSFSPFSDRFFPFTLVVFFWIYLFVLSNGIHAIFVSFALSSFPISRGIDGCIRSQILSHCIRFSYLDLFFLCLLIFFFLSVFTLRCSLVDFVFLRIFVFLQLNGHRKKCHVCVCFISQNWCKMAKKNKRDAQERREEKQQQQPADK